MYSFDYSDLKIGYSQGAKENLVLIDNLENLLQDLNLSSEINAKKFKIGYLDVISFISGSNYRTLHKVSSNYGYLLEMNEMFRVAEDYAKRYGVYYKAHREDIFSHLNSSSSANQFKKRLKVLASYLDKELTDRRDIGTINEGFGYKNNIKLIKYDFVRYH